ncbi:MAG: N-acetyltransferase [Sphingomonas sp.]|uniref:GNAT family N-acetyltransferase n=1 Tax=Sphingomonas sp. TaxID=28214 RepID=UPI001B1BDD9A|nr:GNAT family N-acetyltransferase [Sphingomonas sp.]MBO9622231.1 N-acetyltransferase [Sphingomonas sp.]
MSDVRDNPDRHRFELVEQGHLAFAEYEIADGVITFTHTIVPPSMQGGGVGSRLVSGALAQVRERGLRVVPRCPFVAAYIARHPEWKDLLA